MRIVRGGAGICERLATHQAADGDAAAAEAGRAIINFARRERHGFWSNHANGARGAQLVTVNGADSVATSNARHRHSGGRDVLAGACIRVTEIAGPQRKNCSCQTVAINCTSGRSDAGAGQTDAQCAVVNLGDRSRQGGRQYGWRCIGVDHAVTGTQNRCTGREVVLFEHRGDQAEAMGGAVIHIRQSATVGRVDRPPITRDYIHHVVRDQHHGVIGRLGCQY